MSKELLTIQVELTGTDEVKGIQGEVVMIHFTGNCDCELFQGKILPGGVDTQKQYVGEERILSARYILEGTDCDGIPCKLFIENNGVVDLKTGEIKTTPRILTDSTALSFLETTNMLGTITGWEKGVIIHIFEKNK